MNLYHRCKLDLHSINSININNLKIGYLRLAESLYCLLPTIDTDIDFQ